jgi:hypothetical protein
MLEVGDHLRPLKLNALHLIGVLKVDNPVGTDIHLTSDVEQHTGVVPPTLGLTKMMISNLQLAVFL